MVQVVTLTYAILSVLPAAVLFFVAYGRYDGAFRDTVVFLFFIGGLLAGGFLGFRSLFVYSGINPLFAVLGIAVLVPIGLVAAINRRKYQGERHSVFNGGALGLGASVMFSLSFLYFQSVTVTRQGCAALADRLDCGSPLTGEQQALLDQYVRDHVFTVPSLAQAVLLAIGMTGIFFCIGLLAGDGVRRKKQFRTAFLGTAVFVAPAIFLGELVHAWEAFTGGEWLYTVVLAAFGAIVGFAAERRLLIEGVEEEARKQRRRRQRAERAE